MEAYDVIVIGSGPGGYVGAIRCAQLGLKTAIIEKQWLGGVCLNVGCIPTKSLLKNAELAHTLRERAAEFGIKFEKLELDYSAAYKRSRQVADRLSRGVGFLMKKNAIDVVNGTARIISRNQVSVQNKDGITTELTTKNIVIATGSYAGTIPGVKIDGEKVITYLEAIQQSTTPKSVVIIGAGALGAEFATLWNSYGSKVTLVEMLPRVLPLEDEEVSNELKKAFIKRGIDILTDAKVLSVTTSAKGCIVKVSTGGEEKEIAANQTLIATGFKPNTSNLGLEEIGIELTERKFVQVNEHMATNVPGVWAVGDVTGKLLLAHVASAQGIVCAESIAGVETKPLDYVMMPRATYSQPQVASFGYTEAQAKEKGLEYKVGKFNFQANGKALGLGDYAGFAKIIADANSGELLGAHLIGPEVSELLPELTLAKNSELTVEEIASNVHAHPTLSEVLMEASLAVNGKAIQA
jgi:dihydrolipoamide dehydrogenase